MSKKLFSSKDIEILSKNKYVYTKSIGEEPNRYVVIKLKEENL